MPLEFAAQLGGQGSEVSINQAGEHSAAIDFGVSPRLIRLFVGLEDAEELWQDIAAALDNA